MISILCHCKPLQHLTIALILYSAQLKLNPCGRHFLYLALAFLSVARLMGLLPVHAAFSLQASVDWVPVYLLCPAQKLLQAVCHLSLGIEGEMVAPILPTMLSHMCAALRALPSVTATPYEPVLRAVQLAVLPLASLATLEAASAAV